MLTTIQTVIEEQKQTLQTKKSQSLTQKLKSTLTNISYTIKNSQYVHMPFLTRPTIQIEQNGYAMAYLLGKSYSYHKREEFEERFLTTIWMSYRKVNDQGDVGWGCMIRVVQMVFAEVLRRSMSKASTIEVIELFKEQTNGPLSLSKICKFGCIEKRFTSSPQIYAIMTSLVQQVKGRMKINLTIENYCNVIRIKNEKQYVLQEFPKLISVLAQGGDEAQFQEEYLGHLLSVIKDPSFCGIAAGVGNEALFIVGEYKEMGIILDPHYVQAQQKQETYFEKVPKGIEFTKLKSTFTINFYFESLQAFGEWVDIAMLNQKIMTPFTCFSLEVKNPEGWTKNHRKKSQDFQMLF